VAKKPPHHSPKTKTPQQKKASAIFAEALLLFAISENAYSKKKF